MWAANCRFNLVFITQTHTTHTHLQLLHLKHFVMAHLLSYFHNGVQNLSFLLKEDAWSYWSVQSFIVEEPTTFPKLAGEGWPTSNCFLMTQYETETTYFNFPHPARHLSGLTKKISQNSVPFVGLYVYTAKIDTCSETKCVFEVKRRCWPYYLW